MSATLTLATEDIMEEYFDYKLAITFFLVAASIFTVGSVILDYINPTQQIKQEEEQEDDW